MSGEPASWGRRLRTLAAYVGPGYMIAVGYMDPGNWATDIAGGALYQYSLLSTVLLSSLLAIFLQVRPSVPPSVPPAPALLLLPLASLARSLLNLRS